MTDTGDPAPGDGAAAPAGGALVVIGTPIGNLGDLSPRAVAALTSADVLYCEDTRHSRKLLSHAGITGIPLRSLHDHPTVGTADGGQVTEGGGHPAGRLEEHRRTHLVGHQGQAVGTVPTGTGQEPLEAEPVGGEAARHQGGQYG